MPAGNADTLARSGIPFPLAVEIDRQMNTAAAARSVLPLMSTGLGAEAAKELIAQINAGAFDGGKLAKSGISSQVAQLISQLSGVIWPPPISGVQPVWYADVLNNRYYYNNVVYTGTTGAEATPFSAWLAAMGGLFLRSSAKYQVNASKVLVAKGNDAPCFNYDFSTGAYIGLSLEGARTNDVLQNRDLTNAAWTKTNITAARSTGVDGIASSGSRLTATAGGGTVSQAITAGSAGRVQSLYIKRVTGSGNVSMSMDGGSTFVLIDIVSLWERAQIPLQTLANPQVVIQMATSGDVIDVDFVQNEVGTFITSPILTAGAAATRAEDLFRLGLSWLASTAAGTWLIGTSPIDPQLTLLQTKLISGTDATGVNRLIDISRGLSGPNNINLAQFVASAQTANVSDNSNYSFGSNDRVAVSLTASLAALSVNGAAAISVNPGSISTLGNVSAIDVCRYVPDGSGHGVDNIQLLGYWNIAATATQIAALSTVPGFNLDRSRSLVSQGDSLANASGISLPANSWLVKCAGQRPTFNNGVNGATSTQIKNIVLADTAYQNWLNIYWVGHNDILSGNVITNINLMIANRTTAGGKYLVLSPLQNSGNLTNSATFLGTVSLRTAMASAYGVNYLDVAAALLANGNGSGPDNVAIANGYTPPSLQSDNIHLNDAGYAVVATAVAAALAAKGW